MRRRATAGLAGGLLAVALLGAAEGGAAAEAKPKPRAATSAPAPKLDPAEAAARISAAALASGRAYALVQSLTDRVGHRLAGSAGAERAIVWAMEQLRAAGLTQVRRESFKFQRWERGEESAELIAPVRHRLQILGLGGSIATPAGGIEGEVIEVDSFQALKALGKRAKDKIVFFNKPMSRTANFDGYGAVAGLRFHGAAEAGRAGARAALIRSVGTGAYRLPHTGATRYEPGVPRVPFAALSAEDAEQIHRFLAAKEKVRVRLRLDGDWRGEVETANVVGEVRGREQPEELVLIGAHLDSWDVGAGAIDDGAGCAMVIETARLLQTLRVRPRRSVRVVLFMNEEYGLDGAKAYAAQHQAELQHHVAALEADSGAGAPLGFGVVGAEPALALLRSLAAPIAALLPSGITTIEGAGADLIPLQEAGVPILGLAQDVTHYFDWHHTQADTLDKIDPKELARAVAAFAPMVYALAESPTRLPPSTTPPKH